NERKYVHGLWMALYAVEKLRIADPVPRHPSFHRGERNRLVASHCQHRAFPGLGSDRGEAESAVADHYRGHAVPTRDAAVRIPEQLGIIVRMQIDETGCDNEPSGI